MADHAHLTLSLLDQLTPPLPPPPPTPGFPRTIIHFESEHDALYNTILQQKLLDFHLIPAVEDQTSFLVNSLRSAALQAFPHKLCPPSRIRRPNHCPMNIWFDSDCKDSHRRP